MRVYFPYKAVLSKNLARVFRFSSIKKRFWIIWESESNRNTRMNIPTTTASEYCLIIRSMFVIHSHEINLHLHGSGNSPHSKRQNWQHMKFWR